MSMAARTDTSSRSRCAGSETDTESGCARRERSVERARARTIGRSSRRTIRGRSLRLWNRFAGVWCVVLSAGIAGAQDTTAHRDTTAQRDTTTRRDTTPLPKPKRESLAQYLDLDKLRLDGLEAAGGIAMP